MPVLIFVFYLLSANFKQIASFPHGAMFPPRSFDSNHNGVPELLFRSPPDTGTMIYEHIGDNYFVETRLFGVNLVGLGDGDGDTLTDIFSRHHYGETLKVWESRFINSYPDTIVWQYFQDTGIGYAVPYCAFEDFDQDGVMNLFVSVSEIGILSFENNGNNTYELLHFRPLERYGPAEFVISDFDGDGLLEIVCGDIAGKVYVFENPATGVDSFQLVWTYRLPPGFGNAYSTAKGNDMDGDGKKEFVIAASAYNRWCFTMFETNGNNSYQKVWQYFYYYGGSLTSGDIDCGDVDGDGKDEMVTFGGLMLNVWDCVGPDSFVSIWDRWYYADLTDGVLLVYDLNQNGVAEVVVSGGNWGSSPPRKTYLYEKQPDVIWLYPAKYDTLWANDTVNLRWKLDETTSLESLRIYISNPFMGCWKIYEGLPQDTTCLFVVPDTHSNASFKFWVAVRGYLRYDSIVSHPFYIKRRTGVEETSIPQSAVRNLQLEIYPNPFNDKLNIGYLISNTGYPIRDASLKIFDVSGRIVKSFNLTSPILNHKSWIIWRGDNDDKESLPSGIYFILLNSGSLSAIRKVVKIGG